jgi:hypothetical protein
LNLAEWSLPFSIVLRGSDCFEWGSLQQKAFDELKEYIQHLPTLSSPEPSQPLMFYVSVSHTTTKGNIAGDKKTTQQVPIYFISEALAGSKDTIQKWKKICYAVVMSARKFPHYFEVHRVRVLMNQPLNDIFGIRDSFGRISK